MRQPTKGGDKGNDIDGEGKRNEEDGKGEREIRWRWNEVGSTAVATATRRQQWWDLSKEKKRERRKKNRGKKCHLIVIQSQKSNII